MPRLENGTSAYAQRCPNARGCAPNMGARWQIGCLVRNSHLPRELGIMQGPRDLDSLWQGAGGGLVRLFWVQSRYNSRVQFAMEVKECQFGQQLRRSSSK